MGLGLRADAGSEALDRYASPVHAESEVVHVENSEVGVAMDATPKS